MTLDKQDLGALSRTLLHALRHAPEKYFLELDDDGWVNLDLLLLALQYERPEWSSIRVNDLLT